MEKIIEELKRENKELLEALENAKMIIDEHSNTIKEMKEVFDKIQYYIFDYTN